MFVSMASGLADKGHQVDLVLCKARGEFLPLVPSNVRVVDLNVGQPMASLRPLLRYLKKENPSTLLAGLNQPNVIAGIARRINGRKTRIIISIRSTLSQEAKYATSAKLRMMPWFVRRFGPWADSAVAVSRGAADDYAKLAGLKPGQVHVIYNPVVTQELLDKAEARPADPWFQAGLPPVVLAAGHLETRKDFPTLMRAFAKVRKEIDCRLMILGKGSQESALNELATELGIAESFKTPGFITDPYDYMGHSGVFVLSSLYEGLPGVLIQAMASGCPVVSTDCPSGPCEVLEGGKWGTLVSIQNVDEMADGIRLALTGNGPKPSPKSWQRFTMEAAVKQYEDLLVNNA